VDLDHFKRLNDTLGHQAGDEALARVADVLQTSLRDGDVVARVGGEEFAVLLVDCGVHDGRRRAEELREAVAALGDTLGHEITTSVGIACVPRHAETAADVLAAADVALYRAKAEGRNRVEVAPLPLRRVPRLEDALSRSEAEVS
jgi:diguanylate cyclase (GGDEF)-like protein